MNKTNFAKNPSKRKGERGLVMSVLYGLSVCSVFLLLISAVMCVIEMNLPYPDKYTPAFAFIALFTASFAGGYVAAKTRGKNGFVTGLLFGAILMAVILGTVLAFSLPVKWSLFLVCSAAVIVTSAFAGVAGLSRNSRDTLKPKHKKIKF